MERGELTNHYLLARLPLDLVPGVALKPEPNRTDSQLSSLTETNFLVYTQIGKLLSQPLLVTRLLDHR